MRLSVERVPLNVFKNYSCLTVTKQGSEKYWITA